MLLKDLHQVEEKIFTAMNQLKSIVYSDVFSSFCKTIILFKIENKSANELSISI